jgi:DNA-binding NarL/FixJ family response regulator
MRTVALVDDQRFFSELLAMALDAEPDLSCVGTAATVAEGLRLVAETTPDVVVMGVHVGDDEGIAATAQLAATYPELPVVVLAAFVDRTVLRRAAAAQACALLVKHGSLDETLSILRSAKRGAFAVHPTLLRLLTGDPDGPERALPKLTNREHQVLELLASGSDPRGIARELGISVSTCRGYVKTLLAKVGARSQLEAVAIAVRLGMVTHGGPQRPTGS